MSILSEKIYRVVSQIPVGKVATYGQIARLAGANCPRAVGSILHQNHYPDKIPCHRVVNSRGKVALGYAFGGSEAQIKKLTGEGVVFNGGRVNLAVSLWRAGSEAKEGEGSLGDK